MAKLVHLATLIDLPIAPYAPPPGPAPDPAMAWVPGGVFRMGAEGFYPEEAPVHAATVRGFWMDRYPVTNARFAAFAADTGYLTVAERAPDPADYPGAVPERLAAGSLVFRPPRQPDLRERFTRWAWVPGASWRHPAGPGSGLDGLEEHPVVHVAWDDVEAYARWVGKEIPTEAEWELAARGGLDGRAYAWGDERSPGGRIMANAWGGEFPRVDPADDRVARTTGVGSYPPNGYGLYDLVGNVWEWTSDWWGAHAPVKGPPCAGAPAGDREASFDPSVPQLRIPRKVLKGGSYLSVPGDGTCCRPAARIPQQVDTGTGHQGFRCVVRVAAPR